MGIDQTSSTSRVQLFSILISCLIVDSDQGTARINKGIGALELVPVTCFILSDVNLILILSNLVFKVVFDFGTGISGSSGSSTPRLCLCSSLCRSLCSESLFHRSSNGRSEGRNNVGHHLV